MDETKKISLLQDAATRIRINSIKATDCSKSGHPTSCASIAEIMAVLFLDEMSIDPFNFRYHKNDRFILSKGHAAPALYAAMYEVDFYKLEDLWTLRKLESDLEGHPTPRLPFVDVATGSLGQGLSIAAGMAYCGKYIDQLPYRVFCVIGDGESAEGSIWEAMSFSSHYRLDNLVAIFDINRLGQSEPTPFKHQIEIYKLRAESFGWHVICVDGHSVQELREAFKTARATPEKPVAIMAKTFKGMDFDNISDNENWHGKPLGTESERIIAQLTAKIHDPNMVHSLKPHAPSDMTEKASELIGNTFLSSPPSYKLGDKIATRQAYGTALAKLGKANPRVIGLDGDTKNSTFSIKIKEMNCKQYIECFIAEQNLVGVGIGLACRQRTIPFVSTFAAFLTRAFDQIRMAAVSQSDCNFVGSHAGVSIGEDGPSQMALEDLAMFRSIPTATVFYPSDAVSTERAIELAANTKGICFIRTGRPADSVLYSNDEAFVIGKAKVVFKASNPQVTLIGAGVTLHQALEAAKRLQTDGIPVLVVDPFTIKPLDAKTICECVNSTGGRVVTVEDHYAFGGLGEAVASCLTTNGVASIKHTLMAVDEVPRSGKPDELLAKYRIDATAIVEAVKKIVHH